MDDGQLSLTCDCTPVVDTSYDRVEDASPTVAVVEAIAAVSDAEPHDLTPLNESIDTEALDGMFQNASGAGDPSGTVLGFTVEGWNVFVREDGRIRVCDSNGPPTPSPIFE